MQTYFHGYDILLNTYIRESQQMIEEFLRIVI